MCCLWEPCKEAGNTQPVLVHLPFAQLMQFLNIFYYTVNCNSFVQQLDSPLLQHFCTVCIF